MLWVGVRGVGGVRLVCLGCAMFPGGGGGGGRERNPQDMGGPTVF